MAKDGAKKAQLGHERAQGASAPVLAPLWPIFLWKAHADGPRMKAAGNGGKLNAMTVE